jgi:hypothetical protein
MMSFLATILPFIPKPHKNPLLRHVRNFLVLSWTGYLTILSLSLIVAGSMGGRDWQYSSSALWAGVIGFAVVAIVMRRRGHAVVVADQPVIPPRDLSLVDSWHVVISGVGSDHAAIRERIAARFTGDTDAMNVSQYETYGYRTPNGYEERERLVVSKGQGLVHLHVYDFGNEVFVGWQSYLNWAKWEETTPVSSRVNGNQQTEYRGLRRGIYIPHQLDLIDLSSLSELVHRRLQLEIKAILREKAIDQEIDFRIIRGDRDFALDRSRHEKRESQAG